MKKNSNKRIKENPVMVEKKNIRGISFKQSEEGNEIRTFIIIVLVIAVIVGAIYFFAEMYRKKDNDVEEAVVSGTINYNKISVGMLLNRPYNDYYVLIYNSEDAKAVLYSTMLTKYMEKSSKDNYKKIYFCDLENKLNSKYYNINNDNKSNPDAKSIEELDLGNITLIRVKSGKISSYIEEYEDIKAILG